MYQLIIVLTRILPSCSRKRMDMNNNLANMTPKVICDFCEKSFFGEFLSKHVRISHPGVERPKKKKSLEIKLQPMENGYANQSNCNNSRVFLQRQIWIVNYYVKSWSKNLSNENINTGVYVVVFKTRR